MFWISFDTWSVSVGRIFVLERIYRDGFKWTPWVRVLQRWKIPQTDAQIIEQQYQRTIPVDVPWIKYGPCHCPNAAGVKPRPCLYSGDEPHCKLRERWGAVVGTEPTDPK